MTDLNITEFSVMYHNSHLYLTSLRANSQEAFKQLTHATPGLAPGGLEIAIAQVNADISKLLESIAAVDRAITQQNPKEN